ncbi:MAG: serine/threonine-protein kinase [Myxococcota bacterium]
MDERTVDDPLAGGMPRGGLDFDVTEAAVLKGLFGEAVEPRVGRYRVGRPLGAGAMGQVFEAHDDELDRAVALKLISGERAGTERARGRFLREARALARVNHPNVVAVFEVGVHEGDVFIAMELLRGATLRSWVADERRSWQAVLAVMLQLGDGLAAAHAAGLVHRDLKPDNLWVGEDGRARVIDFGLAMADDDEGGAAASGSTLERMLNSGSDKLTRTGAAVGSPAYMPPEQLMQRGVTERSDQFAFCVTLFEVLHGTRPFVGAALPMVLTAIASGDIVRTDDATPRWIDRVVRRGLAADPAERWPSMGAMMDALRRGPRRRRALWAGGAAAITLAVAGAVAGAPAEAGCAADLTDVWTASRRTDLSIRMQADAGAFTRSVQTPVDAFARRWNDARAEACAADPESAGFDATVLCLDAQREAFEATLGVLDTLTAGSIAEAARVVSGLDDVSPCGGEAPISSAHAAALARTTGLNEAGRYEDAIDAGLAAAQDAPAGVRAHLLFEAADSAMQLGRGSDALSYAEPAYFEALRAGDETLACYAAGLLVGIAGNHLEEFDVAAQWYARASSLLGRIEDDGRAKSKLESRWASALYSAGRAADAVAAYDRAIEAAPALSPLAAATRAGDRANALLEAGRVEEGQAAHVEALAVMETALGPMHPRVGIASDNAGTAYAMAGDYAAARPYFERSLSIARLGSAEGRDIALALGNLGMLEHVMGRYDVSTAYLQEALERFEAIDGPESGWALQTLANLAVNAQFQGDYERAERMYWSVIERRQAKHGPDHPSIGIAKNNLGDNLFKQGRCDDAVAIYEDALRIIEGASGATHVDVAYPLTGLARCESLLGRHAQAREYLERAIDLAQGRDASVLHDARIALAEALAVGAGTRSEANAVLDEALDAARASDASERIEQIATTRESL